MENKLSKFLIRAINFFTSMRFLILISMMLLTVTPVLTFDFVFIRNYKNDVLEQRIDEVKKETQKLSLRITSWMELKKYNLNYDNMLQNGDILKTASSIFDNILIINKEHIIVDDITDYNKGMFIISEDVDNAFSGKTKIKIDIPRKIINCATPIVIKEDDKNIIGVVFTSYPIDNTLRNIDSTKSIARAIEASIVVLALIIVYIIAFILTKPYKKMIKQISELSTGKLQKLSINTFYETREISDAFNRLIAKQLREDEIKQEFVSNVSHELKTPITSIKVLADSLLQQEDLPKEIYKEFLCDICAEIDRESKIITDLLSLSRLEKSGDILNTESISINELIFMIAKRLKPLADIKDIKILFDEFDDVIAVVDKIKLSLVFTNLIENAIKYNLDGGWIRISLTSDFKNFYFTIEDNGIGIPEDEQEDIFERFYRVDKARTSSNIGGTGLGLSITKNIVHKHNGIIEVESDGKCGSKFKLTIPLEQ